MTTALIFAGGAGRRMNSRSKPKQFLEMHGKPIIIYTLEHFEYHEGIDAIVVVCLKEWIKELEGLLKRFGITKVKKIVSGGEGVWKCDHRRDSQGERHPQCGWQTYLRSAAAG